MNDDAGLIKTLNYASCSQLVRMVKISRCRPPEGLECSTLEASSPFAYKDQISLKIEYCTVY